MTDLTIDFLAQYLRENTGRALCDSGDVYGRYYDRPMPTAEAWFTTDYCPVMSLGHWLAANCRHLPEVQKAFDDFAAESGLTWEEDLGAFFSSEKHGFYSYNVENGLDQDFICHVFAAEDEWYYDREAVIVVQSHNGCDARGGFSRPLILSPKEDPSFLFRLCPVVYLDTDKFPQLEQVEQKVSDGAESLVTAMKELGFSPVRLSDDRRAAYFGKEGQAEIKAGVFLPAS